MRFILLTIGLTLFLQFAGAQETASAALAPSADTTPASAQPVTSATATTNEDSEGNFTPSDKRAFGVLPNYRTVEGSNPFVPLTNKQKLTIATKDTIDGPSYALAGLFAGLYQLEDQNPTFGQGLKGYAHRYVTAIADQDIGNYLVEGFLPVVLKEDPRYFRLGKGSIKGRIVRAASQVVISKTDSGHRTFNVSEWLGNGMTAAIGNAYYPSEVGFTPTMARMFTQIGTDAFSDVLKEFWPDFKHKVLKKN